MSVCPRPFQGTTTSAWRDPYHYPSHCYIQITGETNKSFLPTFKIILECNPPCIPCTIFNFVKCSINSCLVFSYSFFIILSVQTLLSTKKLSSYRDSSMSDTFLYVFPTSLRICTMCFYHTHTALPSSLQIHCLCHTLPLLLFLSLI